MRWKTQAFVAALAAIVTLGDYSTSSAQVRVGAGPGGANVRVGNNRASFRLYGRRPWFGNANVRRQLKIDDNQYNTLNDAYVQYWTPYNKVVVAAPAQPNDQYHQQVTTAYGTFNSGLNTTAGQVFTDADVRNRYNQLNLQYQGYAAFQDPTIQTRLKLTDQQRQTFNRYYKDWNDEMNTYANEYSTDREGVNKRFSASWKTNRDRINETLTPEQRKSWNEMTGEAYDFPADVYFDNNDGDRRDGDRRDDGARDNPGRDNPGRDNPGRDNPGRDNPPRNPAPGAGPRENPPRNPAPGAGPRENPPRNPAPGGQPRGEAPRNPAPAPANPK